MARITSRPGPTRSRSRRSGTGGGGGFLRSGTRSPRGLQIFCDCRGVVFALAMPIDSASDNFFLACAAYERGEISVEG